MPSWLRRTVAALVFALLASWAWAPALETALARDEFRTLAESRDWAAGHSGGFARSFEVFGARGHWLTAFDISRAQRTWSDQAGVSARPLRVENALLLAFAAFFLARFLRRALAPWIGADPAKAAGWAAAALFALHPVQAAAISTLSARGDLLALFFAAAAGWLFLHGRQKQVPRALVGALACAVAAGACSDGALALPLWLAIAEFASGKRNRPLEARARTAATTLLVFGAAVALDTLLRSAVLGRWSPPLALVPAGSGDELVRSATIAFERIGTLLVPVDASVLGPVGFTIAGAVTLVALQPALTAARSAPRLWGWMLLAWAIALAATEVFAAAPRVNTRDFTHAASLVASAAIACAGLGVSATAVSGLRRALLPLAIGLGYALLCHANGTAFRDAAAEGGQFQRELSRARSAANARILIALNPPEQRDGIAVLEGALPWMFDAQFTGGEPAQRAVAIRCATQRALLAFAREPEFAALRAEGVALAVPRLAFDAADSSGERELVLLPKPRASGPPREWYHEGRSPALDVDTASTGALLVGATDEAQTERPPVAAWLADEPPLERLREGRVSGAWSYGGDAPEAVFDLSSSLAWLCAGHVVTVWSAEGWSRFGSAELIAELPAPDPHMAPLPRGTDWIFHTDGELNVFAPDNPGAWTLCLLSLDDLEYVELSQTALDSDAAQPAGPHERRLTVAEAGTRAAELAHNGSAVAWSLERRIGGVAVERVRGRWTR